MPSRSASLYQFGSLPERLLRAWLGPLGDALRPTFRTFNQLRSRPPVDAGCEGRRAQRPWPGTCDDGLVIDLSGMKGIRVEGGCTWGDVDHATHPFGLATPSGFISTTGVGGLTLD